MEPPRALSGWNPGSGFSDLSPHFVLSSLPLFLVPFAGIAVSRVSDHVLSLSFSQSFCSFSFSRVMSEMHSLDRPTFILTLFP